MRTPEVIEDPRIIYQCMRTCLIEAINQKVDSIVIPAFGGCTGKVDPKVIARLMFLAYNQIMHQPDKLTWGYAYQIKKAISEAL
jgi:O-acetyl-ADP-ribose deacetylase (regulator of RNase III)